jgi:hypothetical protein
MESSSHTTRHWWKRLPVRLSLRALMFLVLVFAGGLGWIIHRARVQRRAVVAIVRLGGAVQYDWQFGGSSLAPIKATGPTAPTWLRKALGDEYFQAVSSVTLLDHSKLPGQRPPLPPGLPLDGPEWRAEREGRLREEEVKQAFMKDQLACLEDLDRLEALFLVDDPLLTPKGIARLGRLSHLRGFYSSWQPLRPEGLHQLGRLTNLERLAIRVDEGEDADFSFLNQLTKLRSLYIESSKITEPVVNRIGRLKQLELLQLEGSTISDAGTIHLRGLTKLRSLSFQGANLSGQAMKDLREAIPGLVISTQRLKR